MIDRVKLRNALEELDGLVDEASDTLRKYDVRVEALGDAHAEAVSACGELGENVVGILVAAAGLVEEVTLNK